MQIDFKPMSINRKISYYLIFSYLYYEQNEGLITDAQYDELCKDLYENYNLVKSSDHPNKDLVDKFNLECGSGFGIQYTARIKSSAESLKIAAYENKF